MGALVTLELPADSALLELPWIVTFGPLGDDTEWEAVVCGPYERAHALALAEAVVADEDLMAMVEPLMPHTTPDEIRADIAVARESAVRTDAGEPDDLDLFEEVDAGETAPEGTVGAESPGPLPSPEEITAGIVRVLRRITR